MILRSPEQIALMRRAGLVVRAALDEAATLVQPGVATAELNNAVVEVFRRYGATSLLVDFPGRVPFPAASCVSVNDEIAHGIPGPRRLAKGDLVTIDTACELDGWCADAAITLPVGSIAPQSRLLLEAGRDALELVIDQIGKRSLWSQVARELATFVGDSGFHLVEDYLGHGIGCRLHESPEVPRLTPRGLPAGKDFPLKPGLALAIEPLLAMGSSRTRLMDDHWTQSTLDGLPSVHFEHTVAITDEGLHRLTDEASEQEQEQESLMALLAGAAWRSPPS